MWLVESTKGPIITLDWPFSYVLTKSAPRIKVLVPPISSQLDVIHLMRYKYNYVMLLLSTTNKGHYSYFGMEQASLCLDKANVVEVNSECIVEI